jgi:hypothetical protein
VLKKLGLPTHRAGLHAFRHGLGTALANSGASPAVVQRTLRHTDIKTTLRFYVHADADVQRAALAHVLRNWAQYDYSWPGQLDISLVVNPASSAYALDFRTQAEMNRDAARIEPRPRVASETLREVMRLAQTRGGGKTTGRWAFVTNQRPDIEDAP